MLSPPSIISNDCWGGEICKISNIPFRSPFVGLMIMAPDYIKLLENFSFYLTKDLTFSSKSKYEKFKNVSYPIGLLNDEIEIHFMHYQNEDEVLKKWNRRVERIDFSNLFVKFDASKDFADENLVRRFLDLEFKNKLCIAANSTHFDNDSLLVVPEWDENAVKLAYRTYKWFNVTNWFLAKECKPSFLQRVNFKLFLTRI